MKRFVYKYNQQVRRAIFIVVASILLVPGIFDGQAYAYLYMGGDWGGGNLVLVDGDTLSGTFNDVGLFEIDYGNTVTSVSELLGIYANNIIIDGTLKFEPFAHPQLTLSAQTMVINGVIDLGTAPTPIPAASWLLGSGLMGLVGLRRRMRNYL